MTSVQLSSGPHWRIYQRNECPRLKLSNAAERHLEAAMAAFTGTILVADRTFRTMWAFSVDGGQATDVRAALGSGLVVSVGFTVQFPAEHPADLGVWLRDKIITGAHRRG